MKQHKKQIIAWVILLTVLFVGSLVISPPDQPPESIKAAMRDAVLHNVNQVSLFGFPVNPGLISAFTVTGILLAAALLIRIFLIPRFQYVPGKVQLLLEELVGTFDKMAKTNSPGSYHFLGAYIFAAAVYIFTGTMFELFGLQVITTGGRSVAMPAPLSDVNAAIAMGCLTYLAIVSGGVRKRGMKGLAAGLKEFSLPISMSFRLFGALLSGLLVTELVYYYISLSFVLPVAVGIIFTLLHALVQSYVLTMLAALFYGEVAHT